MHYQRCKRLKLYLIKPSKYDEEGYIIRHYRGVLPSNTIACLYSLTEDVKEKGLLGDMDIKTEIIDEAIHKVPVKKIMKEGKRAAKKGDKVIVCLVGVQSNQFPRATDLASRFREAGIDVLIGGFHVSGVMALLKRPSPEVQEIIDKGVIVVTGEVEGHWVDVLRDVIAGKAKKIYDFLGDKPDLSNAPIPKINKNYLKKFAYSRFGTIDCGRGCPFHCNFCTVTTVHGRKMRFRDPDLINSAIKENYYKSGINFYFFTDDNFSRHKAWEKIFDELIRLREEDGIPIQFMIQVDTLSYKIKNFIKKAKRAGCDHVFIGMESLNQKNLAAAGKTQNLASAYNELISTWHDHAVITHVGYIIGFTYDTYQSVMEDIERLKSEVQPDMASFFMLCPLPGSMDWLKMYKSGDYMEADLNKYDSFCAAFHHQNMSDEEWTQAYKEAWKSFYSFENMKAILSRVHPEVYWSLFKDFIWYKSGAIVEGIHPMLSGFFRLKDRLSRRPGFPIEDKWKYLKRRYKETKELLKGWASLLMEMEEIWLQTRTKVAFETKVLKELQGIKDGISEGFVDLSKNYQRAKDVYQKIKSGVYQRTTEDVPLQLNKIWKEVHSAKFPSINGRYSREDLRRFWQETRQNWYNKRWQRIDVFRVVNNFMRDIFLTSNFVHAVIRERR